MRVLAVAALVVVALAAGLWFLIMRDDNTKVVADARAATSKADEAAPVASAPAGEMQPRKAENVGAELRKSITTQRPRDDGAPSPTLPSDTGSGSGKVATPADHMRWTMMRAVHALEPAILECIDAEKKTGANLDAVSSYSFFFVKKGDEIVFDGSNLEYGPYSDALNTCILNTSKTTLLERMPEGATRVKVISKLTVDKGEIKNLQMPSYHVVE